MITKIKYIKEAKSELLQWKNIKISINISISNTISIA